MSNRYDREELFTLLDAFCRTASNRAALSDAQSQRLANILRGSSQARRDYLEYMDLHAALQWEVGSRAEIAGFARHCRQELQAESPPAPHPQGRRQTVDGRRGGLSRLPSTVYRLPASPTLISGLAAVLCAAVVVAFLFFGRAEVVPPQPQQAGGPVQTVAAENAKHRSPEAGAAPVRIVAASAEAVAHVTQLTDCRWADDAKAPKTGEPLAARCLLELRSGLAEIQFDGGARGVLKGPATLEIASAVSAFLKEGEFTVDNPVAKNFDLLSPGRKYMLSSAEFGVYIASADVQEFHVYRGRVAAVDVDEVLPGRVAAAQGHTGREGSDQTVAKKDGAVVVLTANEACRIGAGNKPIERFAAEQSRFVHVSSPVAEPLISEDFRRWEEASRKLRKDPSLIAYYDFRLNAHSLAVLPNRTAAGEKLDGHIDGADWLQGRWPGKGALQCHGPKHCVHLNIPGKYEVVTAAAWINLHDLNRPISSLLDAERQHATAGQCYWRILGDGRMVMGSRPAAGPGPITLSDPLASVKPMLPQSDRGAWCLLAAVYDSRANTVTYYKNGLAFGSVQPSKPLAPLVFGPCELGNGGNFEPKRREDVQYFHGFIDEFMLFSRALSLEELQEIFRNGKCDDKRW